MPIKAALVLNWEKWSAASSDPFSFGQTALIYQWTGWASLYATEKKKVLTPNGNPITIYPQTYLVKRQIQMDNFVSFSSFSTSLVHAISAALCRQTLSIDICPLYIHGTVRRTMVLLFWVSLGRFGMIKCVERNVTSSVPGSPLQ